MEKINTRWIDINKGDDRNPNYRSRLVGEEFNNEAMDGIFAGTPPLEALRCLIQEAATIRYGDDRYSKVIMVNDVAWAFFEAPSVRNVCVELPDEAKTAADKVGDKVGHLNMSLYGTRDAGQQWRTRTHVRVLTWTLCMEWLPHDEDCDKEPV